MILRRRDFVKAVAAGAGLANQIPGRTGGGQGLTSTHTRDVVVVGAGAFGAWTAHHLLQAGLKVTLLDSYGPASDRASSGGESRIIRMGYGADEIYTRFAQRSLTLWRDFSAQLPAPIFHPTGVLWLAHEKEPNAQETLATLKKVGIAHRELTRAQLARDYPQFSYEDVAWAIFEPESGALMARRAIQALVGRGIGQGLKYAQGAVVTPAGKGKLEALVTTGGQAYRADVFVFACGPWLPKVFPEILGRRIFPTRQEVFFFGTPPGDARFRPPAMPTWINFGEEVYGFPDLENRGIKIALDRHGPAFDPDTGERWVAAQAVAEMRERVGRYFPALTSAPLLETRVCQYENTSNGDFLIDRHPDFSNVWLAGGGSGHGLKHGPAVGEYVTARILQGGAEEPRFSLASKDTVQRRSVY